MKSKIIHGHTFQVSAPYAAGHVINEAEAKVLNQTRSEGIGNNLREKIKELLEAANIAGAEELVAQYDKDYTFTLGGTGERRVVDPIEKEALKIAKEQVKLKLAKQGRKLTDVPEGMTEEQWKDKLAETYDTVAANPAVLDAAKKAVAAKKKQADALADAIQLDA